MKAKGRVDNWINSVRRVIRANSSLSLPSTTTSTSIDRSNEKGLIASNREELLTLAVGLKKEAATLSVNLNRTRLFSELRRSIKDIRRRLPYAGSGEVVASRHLSNGITCATDAFDGHMITTPNASMLPSGEWRGPSPYQASFPFQTGPSTFQTAPILHTEQHSSHICPPPKLDNNSITSGSIGIPAAAAYSFPLFAPSYDFNAALTTAGFFPHGTSSHIYSPPPMFLINGSPPTGANPQQTVESESRTSRQPLSLNYLEGGSSTQSASTFSKILSTIVPEDSRREMTRSSSSLLQSSSTNTTKQ